MEKTTFLKSPRSVTGTHVSEKKPDSFSPVAYCFNSPWCEPDEKCCCKAYAEFEAEQKKNLDGNPGVTK